MANASLHIPITGDASQFLAEVNKAVDALRKLQNEFNSALSTSGKKAKLDIDVDAVEGSIADLKQKIKSLEETRNNLSPFDLDNLEAANRQIQEYKNEVSRLQGIGVKIDIEPPPLGSIADLRDSLKKALTLRDLVSFTDTAALEQYNTTIQTLKARIKELEGVGIEVNTKPISPVLENSIAGLQQKLNSLKTAVINVDVNNEDEIARLNTQIIELEQRIARLKNLSIDPSGKVTQSANKARQSLTNLTLVAQDLPFGFIAIQNNLPNLFKSFGDLSSEAGGLKGGLKQLGKAMIGPAGLFFAFSAVTAAVTFAVNEYGSLDAAIRALTGKTTELDGITDSNKKSR